MKSFKSYLTEEQELLIESSTADATKSEKAICYAYNRWKWSGDTIQERYKGTDDEQKEEALSKAGLKTDDYDKFKHLVEDIGKLTAKDAALSWGDYLSHSGSTTSPTNHYASDYGYTASDTTSKSDFVSTTLDAWNISLKKAGDTGAGAQIMSAKGGEGQGVFRAGLEHFEATSQTTLDATVTKALDSFWSELNGTINKELVIQVGGGKTDFKNWYIDPKSSNPRRKELIDRFKPTSANKNKQSPTEKQITDHLTAEMQLLGIPVITSNPKTAQKKLLYNLVNTGRDKKYKDKILFAFSKKMFNKIDTIKNKNVLNDKNYRNKSIEDAYETDKNWTVGHGYNITIDGKSTGTAVQSVSDRTGTAAVIVNPEHLTDIMKKDPNFKDPAKLKKLIIGVTETSMNTKEWAVELGTFYKNNPELKKWFLYEAGSGLFKFTGTKSSGSPYTSKMGPVANKIVVFKAEGGVKAKYPKTILDWAKDPVNIAALDIKNIDISYKTQQTTGFVATRIAAHYESELPMLQEEITRLNAQYMLNEGVFSWVKDKVTVLFDKIKAAVKIFVEKIITKFIDGLRVLAKKGHALFMEAIGIEGSVIIPVPKW